MYRNVPQNTKHQTIDLCPYGVWIFQQSGWKYGDAGNPNKAINNAMYEVYALVFPCL